MQKVILLLLLQLGFIGQAAASSTTVLFSESGFVRCVSDRPAAIGEYVRRNGYKKVPGELIMFVRNSDMIVFSGQFAACREACGTLSVNDKVRKIDCSRPYLLP